MSRMDLAAYVLKCYNVKVKMKMIIKNALSSLSIALLHAFIKKTFIGFKKIFLSTKSENILASPRESEISRSIIIHIFESCNDFNVSKTTVSHETFIEDQ